MKQLFRVSQFEADKPLSQLSTFGIGGPARFFIEIQKSEDLPGLLKYCHIQKLPFFVVGKGSNCLFDDRGFDGLVILNKIIFCQFEWPIIHVGAGYSFSLLGTQSARKGWSGLEFASGIPGTVGGAIYMNAGASGAETCESLIEVTFVNEQGELEILKRDQIAFAYRFSTFQKRKGVIASAKFLLHPSEIARKKQLGIIDYRTRTQPYSDKSAGCVFRNPERNARPQSRPLREGLAELSVFSGAEERPPLTDEESSPFQGEVLQSHSAGALIDQCGLKGKRIGGAEVSTMHANFIVNKGGATSKDILELAEEVKKIVKEKTDIALEMEIRYVPR